jgi:hypothetical protein
MNRELTGADLMRATIQYNQPEPNKGPGKPPKPFKPGVDPVPIPPTVPQDPLYSNPQEAIPI